jgi:hypothetical protein
VEVQGVHCGSISKGITSALGGDESCSTLWKLAGPKGPPHPKVQFLRRLCNEVFDARTSPPKQSLDGPPIPLNFSTSSPNRSFGRPHVFCAPQVSPLRRDLGDPLSSQSSVLRKTEWRGGGMGTVPFRSRQRMRLRRAGLAASGREKSILEDSLAPCALGGFTW